MKYERLTTNNVQSNLQSLLNYAYDKDGEVYLRYANGEEDKRLAEYIAELATEKGCERTADDVIDDGCVECDCEVAVLNAVAIQAAELRHRLAELEDKIESGKMIELPCLIDHCFEWKGGQKIYQKELVYKTKNGYIGTTLYCEDEFEQAEARLKDCKANEEIEK